MKYLLLACVACLSIIYDLQAQDTPEILSSPSLSTYAGIRYEYYAESYDANGDALTFTAVLPSWLTSQNGRYIKTVAGTTVGCCNDGGDATEAKLNLPTDIAFDADGNMYIADINNSRIRKIDAITNIITTVAGTGVPGYSGDGGLATDATIRFPVGLAFDPDGNLAVSDLGNSNIRKIDMATGIITTIAGTTQGFSGDGGLATNAQMSYNYLIAYDNIGNLYITDGGNRRIRKVDTSGIITTIAGTGITGYTGDGGPATSADIRVPFGIAIDNNNNVIFTDLHTHVVRKIDTNGIISTLAGKGSSGSSGDGGLATSARIASPTGIAVDTLRNLVYIMDSYNRKIRSVDSDGIIRTVAGGGAVSSLTTSFNGSYGIEVDPAGDIFVADGGNHRIAQIYYGTYISGTPSESHVGTHEVTLEVSDGTNMTQQVFEITVKSNAPVFSISNTTINVDEDAGPQEINTWAYDIDLGYPVARNLTFVASHNKPSMFIGPISISSSGNLSFTPAPDAFGSATIAVYLKDDGGTANGRVDRSTVQNFTININAVNELPTFISTPVDSVNEDSPYLYVLETSDGDNDPLTYPTINLPEWVNYEQGTYLKTLVGTETGNTLNLPGDMAVDANGNVYFTDNNNNMVKKWDKQTGTVSVIAGTGTAGYNGDGVLATLARLHGPTGIEFDIEGNLYIADRFNNRIRKVANGTGIITTIAGNGVYNFAGDGGQATLASLKYPFDIAFDGVGNMYISDSHNNRIRKVGTNGIITTIGGDGTIGYSGDSGSALLAKLYNPFGIEADDAGNIYFAEHNNHVIRKIDADGIISTIVGTGANGHNGDSGAATSLQLDYPIGLELDNFNSLYIADIRNHRILKLADNNISTIMNIDSTALTFSDVAHLYEPWGVATDNSGHVYIADTKNNRIGKVFNGLIINGDALDEHVGDHNITIEATDGTSTVDHTFAITVHQVNDIPVFTKGNDITVAEDSGLQSITAWATDIDDGDHAVQQLTFELDTDNFSLFEILPTVDDQGTLTFKTASNAHGQANMTIKLIDDGGTERGGINESATVSFLITVTPVIDGSPEADAVETILYGESSPVNIAPSVPDGAEVTYFQISEIIQGQLFDQDGLEINEGNFISSAQALSGLSFKPDMVGNSSFSVQAALSESIDDLGGTKSVVEVIVNKAPLTAYAVNKSISYGEALPVFDLAFTGFVNNEDETVIDEIPVIAPVIAQDAGTYPITVSGGADNNYELVLNDGVLTINKALINVTVADESITYGEEVPEFTVSYTGFVNSEDETVIDELPTVAAVTAPNAGTYEIPLSGGSDNNYELALNHGTLLISKAPLTATAVDQTIVYGQELSEIVITYNGFVNGDDASVIDQAPTVTSMDSQDAGVYQMTLTGGADNNYDLILSTDQTTLVINKAPLIITAVEQSISYGQDIPELTMTFDGFVHNDEVADIDELPTIHSTATSASDAGVYPITLMGGADNNYELVLSTDEATLVITKAALSITAVDQNISYGQPIPELTMAFEGFMHNDNMDDIDVLPTIQTSATTTSDAGEYLIALSEGMDNNYDLNLADGVLLISKALAQIIISDTTHIFDGTAKSVSITTIPADLNVEVSYNGDVNIPSTSGIYMVVASINETNFEGSTSAQLGIQMVTSTTPDNDDNRNFSSSFYPNPAADYLYLNLKPDVSLVRLINISGEVLLQKEVDNNLKSIFTGDFRKGIYLLQIHSPATVESFRVVLK